MFGQTSLAASPLGDEEEEEKEGEEMGEGWTGKACEYGIGRLYGLGKFNLPTRETQSDCPTPQIARASIEECEHNMSSLTVGFAAQMHKQTYQALLGQLLIVGTPLTRGTLLSHMGQQARHHF